MSTVKLPLFGAGVASLGHRQLNPSRLENMYEERQNGIVNARSQSILKRTWGTPLYVEVAADTEFRGMLAFNNILYCIFEDKLYSVSRSRIVTQLQTIDTSTGRVSLINDNGILGIFTTGTSYTYNIATDTLTAIVDGDFAGLNDVKYHNSRAVYAQAGTDTVWVSAAGNLASYDGAAFATAESDANYVQTVVPTQSTLYVIGVRNTESWITVDDSTFPYIPNRGATIPYGTEAPFTAKDVNGTVVFLGQDLVGQRQLIALNNYKATPLLDTAAVQEIQALETVDDAYAMYFQKGGQTFYAITFPTEEKSYLYNFTTGVLSHWSSLKFDYTTDQGNNIYRKGEHLFLDSVSFDNKIIVGDNRSTGQLLFLDDETFTDLNTSETNSILSTVVLPSLFLEDKWLNINTLIFDVERGLTGVSELAQEADDTLPEPILTIKMSKDGGYTFPYTRTVNLGFEGEYAKRIVLRRFGSFRTAVLKLEYSHPSQLAIYNIWAELDTEEDDNNNA